MVACGENKSNVQSIESFFSELAKYRKENKTTVIVLDNALSSCKRFVEMAQKAFRVFPIEFPAPYSPELNHIERVWKLVRRLCTHNRYFGQLDELRTVVFDKLGEWTSLNETLTKLCAIF